MEVGSLLDALLEPRPSLANTEVSSPLLVFAPHLCLQANLSFTSFMSDLWRFTWKTTCEMSSYEGEDRGALFDMTPLLLYRGTCPAL
jgi:hypothetical protein